MTRFLLVFSVVSILGCAPLGPVPGGALRGETHAGRSPDWNSLAAVHTIQLESRPSDPYSVNTWLGVVDGVLYVPSSLIYGPDVPTERGWVRHVQEDARVRLRIEGTVYELRAVRIEDAATAERVRSALLEKYGVAPDEHTAQAWIFRMDAR